MRKINSLETCKWEKVLVSYLEQLFNQWGIMNWTVNGDGYSGLVLKIYLSFLKEKFKKEIVILKELKNYHQAKLLDYDEGKILCCF